MYSESQKLGAMLLGLEQNVTAAAESTGINRTTIYRWYEESGGLQQIKTVSAAQVHHASAVASVAVAQRVKANADSDTIPPKELMDGFRAIVQPAPSTSGNSPPAQAAAFIQVTVPGIAGAPPEVIEVPRDRPKLTEGTERDESVPDE